MHSGHVLGDTLITYEITVKSVLVIYKRSVMIAPKDNIYPVALVNCAPTEKVASWRTSHAKVSKVAKLHNQNVMVDTGDSATVAILTLFKLVGPGTIAFRTAANDTLGLKKCLKTIKMPVDISQNKAVRLTHRR